jgi:uncharacterized protein
MTTAIALWRRLDTPGHDACRLVQLDDGWALEGSAVCREVTGIAQLAYRIVCDREWRSREGRIRGWIGEREVDVTITRESDGTWMQNGAAVPRVQSCVDLDFGFTPATNLFALRRLALREGDAADAPAAWFDPSTRAVTILPQRYTRRAKDAYWYESPTAGYEAELLVDANGFTRVYPGLWAME